MKPEINPAILLVEDSSDDVILIRREFEQTGITNPLEVVSRGPQAIAYLTGSGKYGDRTRYPSPALVLLDINMPGSDGFAVLKWIRRQQHLSRVCVVVLSSSDDVRDVNTAHHLGADSFLVKPLQRSSIPDLWHAVQLKQKT